MGQRLVITIQESSEDICSMYYHWAGYTDSAADETIAVLRDIQAAKELRKLNKEKPFIDFFVKQLEDRGIKRDTEDVLFELDRKKIPYERVENGYIVDYDGTKKVYEFGNRNVGIYATTTEGISSQQHYSEGDVYIDIDGELDFQCICMYSKETFIEDFREDDEDPDLSDIPVVGEETFYLKEESEDFIYNAITMMANIINLPDEVYDPREGIVYEKIA